MIGGGFHLEVGKPFEREKLRSVFNPRAARHFGHGDGVVARNHLYGDVVFAEPFNRLDCVGTDIVGQGDNGDGAEDGGKLVALYLRGRMGHHQHAKPHLRVLLYDFFDADRHGLQDKFGRAHRKGARFPEGDGRKLSRGRERHHRRRLKRGGMAEPFVKGDGSLVIVVEGGQHGAEDIVHGIIRAVVEQHAVAHLHASVGDGARLVEAEHVDAGQHFQRIHILHEGIVFRQADHAYRQRDGRQKQQPRRDHADDDRTGFLNGFVHDAVVGEHDGEKSAVCADVRPASAQVFEIGEEHENADGNDCKPDDLNKEVDRIHDFRIRPFVFFGAGGEFADIGVLADFIHAHGAVSAGDKRACVQRFAVFLFHGHRFARQK